MVLSFDYFPQIISSVATTNLQQLYIDSTYYKIPDIFLETVSVHGRLVHVILNVSSLTVDGIITLVKNSPELLTLNIYAEFQFELDSSSPEDYLKKKLTEIF